MWGFPKTFPSIYTLYSFYIILLFIILFAYVYYLLFVIYYLLFTMIWQSSLVWRYFWNISQTIRTMVVFFFGGENKCLLLRDAINMAITCLKNFHRVIRFALANLISISGLQQQYKTFVILGDYSGICRRLRAREQWAPSRH